MSGTDEGTPARRLLRRGSPPGRHRRPADLAAEVGLDRDEVVAALGSGRYAEAVQADIDQAHRYGISGVPFYVIDGKYGVSGAQPPQTFADALATAAED